MSNKRTPTAEERSLIEATVEYGKAHPESFFSKDEVPWEFDQYWVLYLKHCAQIEEEQKTENPQWPKENGPYTVQDYIDGSWS